MRRIVAILVFFNFMQLLSKESLSSECSFVFIVKDAGKVFQWNGKNASLKQKLRARRFASKLRTYFVMKVEMVEFGM